MSVIFYQIYLLLIFIILFSCYVYFCIKYNIFDRAYENYIKFSRDRLFSKEINNFLILFIGLFWIFSVYSVGAFISCFMFLLLGL
jgi:nitrate reductase NapE component